MSRLLNARRLVTRNLVTPLLLVGVFASAGNADTLLGIVPSAAGSLPPGPFVGDSGIGGAPPTMVNIMGTGTLSPNPSDTWTKNISWNYTASAIDPGDQ